MGTPTSVEFYKIVPGGNPTIIVTGSLPHDIPWPTLAAQLIGPMHIQAEQAGALSGGTLPHLHMMGGEFCVNATRAAAFLLAIENQLPLNNAGVYHGFISVSGAQAPVYVAVAPTQKMLQIHIDSLLDCFAAHDVSTACTGVAASNTVVGSVAPHGKGVGLGARSSPAFAAARLTLTPHAWQVEKMQDGACVVYLPGISHVLLPAHIFALPHEWAAHTRMWRERLGLLHHPASGVVWYSQTPEGFAMTPFVYVRDTDTEHAETACGSAALALALALHTKSKALPNTHHTPRHQPSSTNTQAAAAGSTSIAVLQPSGEYLEVTLHATTGAVHTRGTALNKPGTHTQGILHAYVAGKVVLVAQGTAYVEPGCWNKGKV